nr:nucleotidyltransferase domain-containing protein [Pseudomonas costantinii]
MTVADAPLQPEFQPLLADVCATLSQADIGLDGIYVYGSVARGDAVPGDSDLDLTVVFSEPPHSQALEQLELLRQALELRHPVVTKIDVDIGHRAEVLAPENSNRWGFWLKHHCRCVWGDDLSQRFERFEPSREIALAVNGDFKQVLSGYLTRIGKADSVPERLRLQREASRKLLRATHTLRAEDALMWPHTLEEHVGLFVQHYPTMRIQIAYFLFEARNPSAEREAFSTRLQSFVAWMVSQQG